MFEKVLKNLQGLRTFHITMAMVMAMIFIIISLLSGKYWVKA